MRNFIPQDVNERLAHLNKNFTEVLFSRYFFEDSEWLTVRLNLRKWRLENYVLQLNIQPMDNDFTTAEERYIYQIIAAISEIQLLSFHTRERARKNDFKSASDYHDLQTDRLNNLTKNAKQMPTCLPFFYLEDKILHMKCIDNYFITSVIKERFRLN